MHNKFFVCGQILLASCHHTFVFRVAVSSNSGSPHLPGANARLDTGASIIYQIPAGGWAGRIWPKIQCDGSGNNCLFGQSSPPCPPNGCQPPADTKAEFNFVGNGEAWYDISLVDGDSNLVLIVPKKQVNNNEVKKIILTNLCIFELRQISNKVLN